MEARLSPSRFRWVPDEPGFTRWELDDLASCHIREPMAGGRIWTWAAWTETGRKEHGMAHSRESAIREAKAGALRLVAEDLDSGLPRSAQMEWEQGLYLDTPPSRKGRPEEPS